jgi:sugar/nucleoside kinase (ribokinase family)
MPGTCDAVVAGHICLDVIPDLSSSPSSKFDALFVPGHLVEVGPAAFSTGGAVSNTGLTLNKLGIRTQLMGKLGNDLFGEAIRHIIASHGPHLAEGTVVDGKVSTSYTVIISPPGVDRMFLHCPGANDTFSADDVSYERVSAARMFHLGYPPVMRRMYEDGGHQLVATFRRAKATGVTTSLDMAFTDPSTEAGRADWVRILQATLPHVDIFMPSIEEILYMLRREIYENLHQAAHGTSILPLITPELLSGLSQHILDMGVKIVGLKLGERGLYLRTAGRAGIATMGRARPTDATAWADREMWSPCFQVDVVGTTGAGDATIAGFIAALLRDLSPEAALTAAVAVGACNVEAADALSGIRSWEETRQRVQGGWARRPLTVTASGWRLDTRHQVWVGPHQ